MCNKNNPAVVLSHYFFNEKGIQAVTPVCPGLGRRCLNYLVYALKITARNE